MKKFRIIDNTLGWLVFIVAAITYCLTIEPTASFWDCPEFIAQAFKSEVGHPPGNPIFILLGRFAANFAGGDVMAVSKCVNIMSALLSAGTILFLFWTITHLVKKLVVADGEEEGMTLVQYLVVMGSGICGALAYTWSDTFWFSAVEAEVYAFSSFCTALVFWLILKWEDQADDPKSDRWIILIAYVFGFSLGVHLLNLLCIPAIALVFYYRKYADKVREGKVKYSLFGKERTLGEVSGSLLTLLISCVLIVLILYGMEPGIVTLGGYFDRFFVNTLGMSFNSGVVFYAFLALATFAWAIYEVYKYKNDKRMRISFFFAITLSGMLFIGKSGLIPLVLIVALGVYLFKFMRRVPRRFFSNVLLSTLMIFVGFSCYSLIIIRSNANTPLDENAPDTMFGLSSYLSREQYGKTPLLWGPVYTATTPQYQAREDGSATTRFTDGATQYGREVKQNPSDPDRYVVVGKSKEVVYPSEMNMLFPRIWSSSLSSHVEYYNTFFDVENHPFSPVAATIIVDQNGNESQNYGPQSKQMMPKPSFGDNIQFFLGYQLNYMYMRYFLWNFAGRQNDIQGLNGEIGDVTRGNWITGFDWFDNMRLGDQSLLPDDEGKDNKGHNVFYCLPLLLGIIGLLWQAFAGKRGIEQFWVIFFLFFMTGIAIVLYLNQPPLQPRERDYAYAGSFYAYAIWIGMGVAGIWRSAIWLLKRGKAVKTEAEAVALDREVAGSGVSKAVAGVAFAIGILVPLQMVSQTWDDHDRSGRFCARDFGMNYLSSLDDNAIIFTNGDNDTFPLWYLQEVEGYRTDVRVVNLSYLATDWYIQQMQRAAYNSAPVPMQATNMTYAYGNRAGVQFDSEDTPMSVTKALEYLYDNKNFAADEDGSIRATMKYGNLYINADTTAARKAGVLTPDMSKYACDVLNIPFESTHQGYVTASDLVALDIINTCFQQGFKRPVYFACTVDSRLYQCYSPYLQNTGMAYEVTPALTQKMGAEPVCNTDKMYKNVTTKFRWGGLDTPEGKAGKIYLDETVRRMVNTTRTMIYRLAADLLTEAELAKGEGGKDAYVADRVKKAETVLALVEDKITTAACPFSIGNAQTVADCYNRIYQLTNNEKMLQKAILLTKSDLLHYAQYTRFVQALAVNHSNLSTCNYDAYAAHGYMADLLMFYQRINEKGYEGMLKEIASTGVDINDLKRYIEYANSSRQQQAEMVEAPEAAMPDTTMPVGGDDEESQALMGMAAAVGVQKESEE